MILITIFSLLLPAFCARQTGVPDFVSFQSALRHNLLSNHSFRAEHSAVLRHTRCGGDELCSTDSSTVGLDAGESGALLKLQLAIRQDFWCGALLERGACCCLANPQRSAVVLGCAKRVFCPHCRAPSESTPSRGDKPRGEDLTLLPTSLLLPQEQGLLWSVPSRFDDFSLSLRAWAAHLCSSHSLFWFGHGTTG